MGLVRTLIPSLALNLALSLAAGLPH